MFAFSKAFSFILLTRLLAMVDTLETAQYFIFVTQAYFCSMYAVVLWDWMTSLPREWLFIWKTRWSPVKAAYLFCRYWVIAVVPYLLYCFVMDHPTETCERIYPIPVTLALWNQAGAESVLLIRTYAFFNRNNYLLTAMICALLSMIAYQLYVATSQMLLLPFVKPPFTSGPCLPMSKPHSEHLLFFFLAPLMFDTIVTLLTVLKASSIRRQHGVGSSSRLIQTFLREGVFYYILISIANLVNGIFYLQPRQVISAINIPLSVMLSPVLACRLILDLRQRGSEAIAFSDNHPFSSGQRSGTNFQFSHRSTAGTFSTPTRAERTYNTTPKSLNAGLTFATFGSVSGVDVGDLELGSVGRTILEPADKESDEGDITSYRAVELGIAGIRIDVEKVYETR